MARPFLCPIQQTNVQFNRRGSFDTQSMFAEKFNRKSFHQTPCVINSVVGFEKQSHIDKKSRSPHVSNKINNSYFPSPSVHQPSSKSHYLAMDCEMVGVGPMKVSVLARVSIVSFTGQCIFDAFVKVEEKVTDYRTAVSGIRPEDLESTTAMCYGDVRSRVKKILAGNILVGHGLLNDLVVLNLNHPAHLIRDTSQYLPFMKQWLDGSCRPQRLRDLAWDKFGVVIQAGEHCSIEDARAAMSLYKSVKDEWDELLAPPHSPYRYESSTSSYAANRGSYHVPHAHNNLGESWSQYQHYNTL
jgi:DNA polymerase III epsilon subunit-like protein